jgi:hypothetical protein
MVFGFLHMADSLHAGCLPPERVGHDPRIRNAAKVRELNARRDVGGVAHRCVVLPKVVADAADHHGTAVQSHAQSQRWSVGGYCHARGGLANGQRGHRAPLGVVFVRQRRAEQQCRHFILASLLRVDAALAPTLARKFHE